MEKNDDEILVTARNISTAGNVFSNGKFELYYDAVDGERKEILDVAIEGAGSHLGVNESLHLVASKPEDVSPDKEDPYLLIFDGQRGEVGYEPVIAASVFDTSPGGIVNRLVTGVTACTAIVYAVEITFEEQPDNGDQVLLRGFESDQEYDFRDIVADTFVLIN